MIDTKLLPCPFCGGDKLTVIESEDLYNSNNGKASFNVSCRYTDCHGAVYSLTCWQFETEKKAIEAWNTRPVNNIQQYREALEKYANEEVSMFDDSGEIAREALKGVK